MTHRRDFWPYLNAVPRSADEALDGYGDEGGFSAFEASGFEGYGPGRGVESALPEWWQNDGAPKWTTWSGTRRFDTVPATAEEHELARIELPWPMPVSVAATHTAQADIEPQLVMRFQLGNGRAAPSIFKRFPVMLAPFITLVGPGSVFLLPARMLIVYVTLLPTVPAAALPIEVGVSLAPVAPLWSP